VPHVTSVHVSLAESGHLGISEFYTVEIYTSSPERDTIRKKKIKIFGEEYAKFAKFHTLLWG